MDIPIHIDICDYRLCALKGRKCFNLSKQCRPDDHHAAIHLDLHCLSKYPVYKGLNYIRVFLYKGRIMYFLVNAYSL